VAHEIAHGYGKMTDHHNADFRGRYVAICRALFPDAADGLRDAFTAHGMNVGPEVLPTPETTLPHPTATKETE
jgi:hypothetical protein